jgi:hypothetical protein
MISKFSWVEDAPAVSFCGMNSPSPFSRPPSRSLSPNPRPNAKRLDLQAFQRCSSPPPSPPTPPSEPPLYIAASTSYNSIFSSSVILKSSGVSPPRQFTSLRGQGKCRGCDEEGTKSLPTRIPQLSASLDSMLELKSPSLSLPSIAGGIRNTVDRRFSRFRPQVVQAGALLSTQRVYKSWMYLTELIISLSNVGPDCAERGAEGGN